MPIRPIAHLKRTRKYRAQGLVEFALILPVLLLVVFVIVELARVLHAWMAVENGARFGVRYAVTGEWNDTYCPGGTCNSESEEDVARIPSIEDAARVGAVAILRDGSVTDVNEPGFFRITVCSAKPLPVPPPRAHSHPRVHVYSGKSERSIGFDMYSQPRWC